MAGRLLAESDFAESLLLGRLETSGFGRLEVDFSGPELLKLEPGEGSSGSRGGLSTLCGKMTPFPGGDEHV